MTIEISLINWITNLEDESGITQIEDFRKSSLDELSKENVELLQISDSKNIDNCIEHANSRAIHIKK